MFFSSIFDFFCHLLEFGTVWIFIFKRFLLSKFIEIINFISRYPELEFLSFFYLIFFFHWLNLPSLCNSNSIKVVPSYLVVFSFFLFPSSSSFSRKRLFHNKWKLHVTPSQKEIKIQILKQVTIEKKIRSPFMRTSCVRQLSPMFSYFSVFSFLWSFFFYFVLFVSITNEMIGIRERKVRLFHKFRS